MSFPNMLNRIFEGMDVYDNQLNHIGRVTILHRGVGTLASDEIQLDSIIKTISQKIDGIDYMPSAVYQQLYEEGFIYINNGFLKPKLIIPLTRVVNVDMKRVQLISERSSLLRI